MRIKEVEGKKIEKRKDVQKRYIIENREAGKHVSFKEE